jgi:hypothetical protein
MMTHLDASGIANTSMASDEGAENVRGERRSRMKTVTSSLDDVQHIHSINEFERQVLDRIYDQGFTADHISQYIVHSARDR